MEKLTDKLFGDIKGSDVILDPVDSIFKVNSKNDETTLIFIPRKFMIAAPLSLK